MFESTARDSIKCLEKGQPQCEQALVFQTLPYNLNTSRTPILLTCPSRVPDTEWLITFLHDDEQSSVILYPQHNTHLNSLTHLQISETTRLHRYKILTQL